MFLHHFLKKLLWIVLAVVFAAKIYTGQHLSKTFLERGNSKSDLNPIAYNLLLHNQYSIATGTPSIDFEPFYPFLMYISYKMGGINWHMLTYIQCIMHLLTSLLIFRMLTHWWNELAGFIAAVYYSVYPYLFSYSLGIYDTVPFIFLLVLIVYYTLIKNQRPWHFAAAGVFIGLAFLTRATVITFLPPLFLFLIYTVSKREGYQAALKKLSLLLVTTALTLAPWLVRNYNLTGEILVSTHGPFGLWQGNNPLTRYYLSNNISLDALYYGTNTPAIYRQYPFRPRPPKEALQAANAYKAEAVNWVKSNPSDFISLAFLKAQKLWTWNRNPSSFSLKFGSNEGRKIVNTISYLPLLLCMPYGFILLYRKNKEIAWAIAGILICFTGAHMVAMGFTRARIPIDFFLMMLFGIVTSHLFYILLPGKFNSPLKTSK